MIGSVVNIYFACPSCAQAARIDLPATCEWQCQRCDHLLHIPAAGPDGKVAACVICGNEEFFVKKDFPHWLGLSILTFACLAFLIANAVRHQWLAWVILIGSAIVDGALYLWVGDVTVCYRCGTHLRGFPANAEHKPFEIGVAERFRQERIRREQLQQERKS